MERGKSIDMYSGKEWIGRANIDLLTSCSRWLENTFLNEFKCTVFIVIYKMLREQLLPLLKWVLQKYIKLPLNFVYSSAKMPLNTKEQM